MPSPADQPWFLGLPTTVQDARVVLLGVPFDATTTYRTGTALGPMAILEASAQIDLDDPRLGRISDRGIAMEPIEPWIAELSAAVRPDAEPIIAAQGQGPLDEAARQRVDAACERVNDFVRQRVADLLDQGKTPGVVGGEHGVSLGAIDACAARVDALGVLQIDAHMDLREAYCGLAYSHASVMRNALMLVPGVSALSQVAIRDACREEFDFARQADQTLGKKVTTVLADDLAELGGAWQPFQDRIEEAIKPLPQHVYLTFDIDALEVYLCPNTGTPVPGGLTFHQAQAIIQAVIDSGRTVVGFDLVEVAPDPQRPDRSIDAVVGARLLYKLCALAGR